METLGLKIRTLRKEKCLKICEMAKVVNVSPSLISQVERGYVMASLVTLEKIAKALNTPMSDFFESTGHISIADESDFIVRKDHRKIFKFANSPVLHHLLSTSLNSGLEFLLIEVPPKTSKEEFKKYKHQGEEYFYVIDGELTLYLDGNRYTLKGGDSGSFDSGVVHSFENEGDKTVTFLIAATDRKL